MFLQGATLVAALGLAATAAAGPHADYQKQLEREITATLAANQQAATQEAWARSGSTPDHVLEISRALATQPEERSQVARALCAALLGLSSPNLAIFESALARDPGALDPACLAKTRSRLSFYWRLERERLSNTYGPAHPPTKDAPETEELAVDVGSAPVIFHGGLGDGEVAFTFDDGPDREHTRRLAKALLSARVRGDFFLIGSEAKRFPDVVTELVSDQHVVGSHSWSHPLLTSLAPTDAQAEILNGWRAVYAITDQAAPFFRFPFGARDAALQDFVRGQGLTTFFWTIDSLDWKTRDTVALYQHVTRELASRKGGILLMHSVLEQSVIVASYLASKLGELGYQPVVFTASADGGREAGPRLPSRR